MPLAFAALLGGLNTLIGTPPNILISDGRGHFRFSRISQPGRPLGQRIGHGTGRLSFFRLHQSWPAADSGCLGNSAPGAADFLAVLVSVLSNQYTVIRGPYL